MAVICNFERRREQELDSRPDALPRSISSLLWQGHFLALIIFGGPFFTDGVKLVKNLPALLKQIELSQEAGNQGGKAFPNDHLIAHFLACIALINCTCYNV